VLVFDGVGGEVDEIAGVVAQPLRAQQTVHARVGDQFSESHVVAREVNPN